MSLVVPQANTLAAFEQLVRRRRATPHFTAEEVPPQVIETALRLAAEAPSGYNLQPWRYVIVQDPDVRSQLRQAAFNQEKITEAPVVVIACAEQDAWQEHMEEIFRARARHSGRANEDTAPARKKALDFIETLPREVWLNRHVMIGFTYLMLAFEAQGWDTAPMEGFTASAVREVAGLPADCAVMALLAVGRAAGAKPPHPGRLAVDTIAFGDRFGDPLPPHFTRSRIMKSTKQSKILLHGQGTGDLTNDDVEKRASEIALIRGASSGRATESDRAEACAELKGDLLPATADTNGESQGALSRDPSEPISDSGHQVANHEDSDNDDNNVERLATEGVEEAQHDQMLAAREREHRQDRL